MLILNLPERKRGQRSHFRIAVLRVLVAAENVHERREPAWVSYSADRENGSSTRAAMRREKHLDQVIVDFALVFVLDYFWIEYALGSVPVECGLAVLNGRSRKLR